MPHSKSPVNEYDNSALFPCMFPHLFPFGLGGVENPKRRQPVTMQAHIKHLLNLNDTRFQTDGTLPFVAMNILQRCQSSKASRFKVKRSSYKRINELLCSAEASACDAIIERSRQNGGYAVPQNAEEKQIFELMSKVNIISGDVPGSAVTKTRIRNEIRSLIHWLGSPTFFVTINPADVYSPLFCHFAGCMVDFETRNPDLPSDFECRLLLARNPAAGARFFNAMMQAFIDTVIDLDNPKGGLFGNVAGYYGVIEAQGRGSLHCHMLIWIEGSLGPQALRDKIETDSQFKDDLFRYLEEKISTALPQNDTVVSMSAADFIEREKDEPHPCTLRCPDPRTDDDFDEE